LERRVAAVSVYGRDSQLAKSEDGAWISSYVELNEATEFWESVLRDPISFFDSSRLYSFEE